MARRARSSLNLARRPIASAVCVSGRYLIAEIAQHAHPWIRPPAWPVIWITSLFWQIVCNPEPPRSRVVLVLMPVPGRKSRSCQRRSRSTFT